MKHPYARTVFCCLFGVGIGVASAQTLSGGAVRESAQASTHGSRSAAYSLAASGQTTLALSAVPMVSVGTGVLVLGMGSASLAQDMPRPAAALPVRGKPQALEISEETVTLARPEMAMQLLNAPTPKAKTQP